MKKNLLLILLAVIFGATTAAAEMVSATIEVDKAANVVVTNGMYGTVVNLQDGVNRLGLDGDAQPLVVKAADGAEITSVTCNGQEVSSGYNGYTMGITQGMYVKITTTGGSESGDVSYNVFFMVDPLGSINVSYGDTKKVIDEAAYLPFPGNTDLTIAPEEGFTIENVDYYNGSATDNGNGTWTVNVTNDYAYIAVTVKKLGIDFNVDVNVASNIKIEAILDNDATVLEPVALLGSGPCTATAPTATKALQFSAAEGGEINSITRIDADGNESVINYSGYVGYRATLAQGDTFVIDVTGPEAELTFSMQRTTVTLDQMIISVNGTKLNVTAANPTAKAHVGDIVTVTGGRGAELTTVYPEAGQVIVSNGATQSFKVLGKGNVYLYANVFSGRVINVDNAAAVIVKDQNGYGDQITLSNGTNTLENVKNPLSIAAAAEYAIVSVVLNGETVAAKADGTYTVALEEGSTLSITTKELPKALPVTFSVIGDYTQLIVTNEGEAVELTGESTLVPVMPGAQFTVGVQQGFLIESLLAGNGNDVMFDEESGVYTITVHNAGTISVIVNEWVAAPGNALVTFTTDSPKVSGIIYDENGQQLGTLNRDGITEVKDGSKITLRVFGDPYFKTVTVNGKIAEDATNTKTFDVTVDGTTVIDVTTYILCTVTGYSTSDPVNHSIIGYMYVNEPGQLSAQVAVGETVTLLPTPAAGFKFDGFSFIYPEDFQVPETAPYTFTIPEGVTELIFQGTFVADEENLPYLVRGNNTLGILEGEETTTIIAVTRIYNEENPNAPLSEKLCVEGETVQLLCYLSQEAYDLGYECKSFALWNDTSKLINQLYVVNPDDVAYDNVIEVSAIVEKTSGVEDVAVNNTLSYNRTTAILTSSFDVKIFGTSGNLVKEAEAGEISLESLPAGIYIITAGNKTLKITK